MAGGGLGPISTGNITGNITFLKLVPHIVKVEPQVAPHALFQGARLGGDIHPHTLLLQRGFTAGTLVWLLACND